MVKPHRTFRLIWVRALQRREQEVDLIPVLNQPHRNARLCLAGEDDEIRFDGANIRHVEGDLTAEVHEANPYIVLGIELGFKEPDLCFETTDAARCRLRLACFSRRAGALLPQLRHLAMEVTEGVTRQEVWESRDVIGQARGLRHGALYAR